MSTSVDAPILVLRLAWTCRVVTLRDFVGITLWWCGPLYLCLPCSWDNGETERLSPWDMEPVDQNRKNSFLYRILGFFSNKLEFTVTWNLHLGFFLLCLRVKRVKKGIIGLVKFSDLPARNESCVPVQPEELRSLMYTPVEGEWPTCGRDAECNRIAHGMESVMQHSIAEQFLTPVDLNVFPIYGIIIEYLIDLTTIKSRLENRFYR